LGDPTLGIGDAGDQPVVGGLGDGAGVVVGRGILPGNPAQGVVLEVDPIDGIAIVVTARGAFDAAQVVVFGILVDGSVVEADRLFA
jgi:hypothetical protein